MKCNETEFKKIIKNNLVTPPNWDSEIATECFSTDLFELILNQICMI